MRWGPDPKPMFNSPHHIHHSGLLVQLKKKKKPRGIPDITKSCTQWQIPNPPRNLNKELGLKGTTKCKHLGLHHPRSGDSSACGLLRALSYTQIRAWGAEITTNPSHQLCPHSRSGERKGKALWLPELWCYQEASRLACHTAELQPPFPSTHLCPRMECWDRIPREIPLISSSDPTEPALF